MFRAICLFGLGGLVTGLGNAPARAEMITFQTSASQPYVFFHGTGYDVTFQYLVYSASTDVTTTPISVPYSLTSFLSHTNPGPIYFETQRVQQNLMIGTQSQTVAYDLTVQGNSSGSGLTATFQLASPSNLNFNVGGSIIDVSGFGRNPTLLSPTQTQPQIIGYPATFTLAFGIPEPSTWVMLMSVGASLLAGAYFRRRRRLALH